MLKQQTKKNQHPPEREKTVPHKPHQHTHPRLNIFYVSFYYRCCFRLLMLFILHRHRSHTPRRFNIYPIPRDSPSHAVSTAVVSLMIIPTQRMPEFSQALGLRVYVIIDPGAEMQILPLTHAVRLTMWGGTYSRARVFGVQHRTKDTSFKWINQMSIAQHTDARACQHK